MLSPLQQSHNFHRTKKQFEEEILEIMKTGQTERKGFLGLPEEGEHETISTIETYFFDVYSIIS